MRREWVVIMGLLLGVSAHALDMVAKTTKICISPSGKTYTTDILGPDACDEERAKMTREGRWTAEHAEATSTHDLRLLVVEREKGTVGVLAWISDGTYALAVDGLPDESSFELALVDLDLDGTDDLVWENSESNELELYYSFGVGLASTSPDAVISVPGDVSLQWVLGEVLVSWSGGSQRLGGFGPDDAPDSIY